MAALVQAGACQVSVHMGPRLAHATHRLVVKPASLVTPQAMTPCLDLESSSACLYVLDQGIHLCPVIFTHVYASLSAAAADPGVWVLLQLLLVLLMLMLLMLMMRLLLRLHYR